MKNTTSQATKSASAASGEKPVKVRIPLTGDDSSDVFVSVNDRNWYIKRGALVEIPECAAEVLMRREERISEALEYENKVQSREA